MRIVLVSLAGVFYTTAAWGLYEDAVNQRPCMDYWTVGDVKDCGKPEKKPAPPPVASVTPTSPPPPVTPTPPPSPTLDKKIDEFIANHGKPPREFVAFYLDPTPEHAIQWVAKYNELLNRGQEIAVAWTQAEKLYNDKLKTGVSATALNPNPLPPVPDFGIPVPGFNTPAYSQLMNSGTTPIVSADMNALTELGQAPADPAAATGLLKPTFNPDAPFTGKPLQVSYYFSSLCPYCKKFTPELAQVLQQTGNRVQLTCVDVTPEIGGTPQRSPNNLDGTLPCNWRAATDEELNRLNIKQTPSLVINKGGDKPLELISGYVEGDKLKNYIFTNTQ